MSQAVSWEQFVRQCVDSLETLEILLLLQREPAAHWTPVAIDSHFGMKSGLADKRLKTLLKHGLVIKNESGGFRFAPKNEELRAGAALLAVAYADRRSNVVNTIFSENLDRLRAFSDAFKVKSE